MNENEAASRRTRRAVSGAPVEAPPGLRPLRGPLAGSRVRAEPIDPAAHHAALFADGHVAGQEKLWDYLPYGPFDSPAAMRTWMRTCAASADPVFYALRDADGRLGGMASLMEIRPLVGVIEIGNIWFCPHFQRSVAATEALVVMMRHAMDDLGNRRLEWKCNALNAPSRRAALRLGFRYEGEFLNHMVVKGCNRDTAWFSITDTEWPSVRAAHERWLDPANFAADGAQKTSLSALTRALW
jgi:RimJ/RimL family protein N-acetyltransferase